MIYHVLDELIYRNSRDELIQLLGDIYPRQHIKFKSINVFDETASSCEFLIDKYFPILPYSQERLALCLHLSSNAGLLSIDLRLALASNNRAQI